MATSRMEGNPVIQSDQAGMLYSSLFQSVFVTFVAALVFLGVHSEHMGLNTSLSWFFMLSVVLFWRTYEAWNYRQGRRASRSPLDWLRYHRAGTLLTGAVWGLAGVLFFPMDGVQYQLFTVLVLAGLAAGALSVHAPDYLSYVSYSIPTLVPVGLASLLQGTNLHLGMGILVLALALFLLRAGKRMHASFLTSLQLRYENLELLEGLEREKARLDNRLARVLDGSAGEVYVFDGQNLACKMANAGAVEGLGYGEEELRDLGVLDIVDVKDRGDFELITAALRHTPERSMALQVRHRRKDGTTYPVEARLLYTEREEPPVFVMTALDVTVRAQAEKVARERQALVHSVVSSAPISLWSLDLQGNFTFFVDTGFWQSDEFPRASVGENIFSVFSTKPQIVSDAHQALAGERFVTDMEVEGSTYEIHYSPLLDADHQMAGAIGVALDNTDRKQYERKLIRQANFDDLTGLPNKNYLMPRLMEAFVRARRERCRLGLLFMDLDNFKTVNDTLGHKAGDQLLQQVGGRVQETLRDTDALYRISGDEFVVMLEGLKQPRDAEVVARKVLDKFENPFVLSAGEVFATGSIGICYYPDDGETPEKLMQSADAAMYGAKAKGRNTYHLFTREMREDAERRMAIESRLRRAMERDELSLVYQPKVATGNGDIKGAEVLLRWHNPDLGWVPPDQFISIAEDAGLINEIGRWVIEKACAEAVRWQALCTDPVSVAINISSRQFRGENLLEAVERALEDSSLPSELLELEITESLLVQDAPETLDMLDALRRKGVKMALDDFGTGYSSLSYLKRFPMDVLKIDRSFVRDIGIDPSDEALVEAIVAMAHALELELVAEGVETAEQMHFLRLRDIDLIQGYYYSPPVSSDRFREMISATPPRLLPREVEDTEVSVA
ncbi:MAG: EAL domain-containing protein [Sedimenticola sp.]